MPPGMDDAFELNLLPRWGATIGAGVLGAFLQLLGDFRMGLEPGLAFFRGHVLQFRMLLEDFFAGVARGVLGDLATRAFFSAVRSGLDERGDRHQDEDKRGEEGGGVHSVGMQMEPLGACMSYEIMNKSASCGLKVADTS